MRYVFAVLGLLMALFAVVQFNDPDGPTWMVFYGVPAVWAGLAAVRPHLLSLTGPRLLLAASLVAAVVLVVVFWPPAEQWWRTEVWWESEESREGMGLMIATLTLAAVFVWSVGRAATDPAMQKSGRSGASSQ